MVELCRFDNIIIRIFYEDQAPPHFHVKYNEHSAQFSINDGELLNGNLPARQLKLAQAWWILREAEVKEAWNKAVNNIYPGKIEPLK